MNAKLLLLEDEILNDVTGGELGLKACVGIAKAELKIADNAPSSNNGIEMLSELCPG